MDDYSDTKSLRKNMFVSNNERDDNIYRSKIRSMEWDVKRRASSIWDSPGLEGLADCHQALRSTDILENIAVHLPHEDILNCRMVCKHWSSEMAMFLHKRKSLIVVNEYCPAGDDLIKKRLAGDPIAMTRLSLFDISSSCAIYKQLLLNFGGTLSIINVEGCRLTPKDLKAMLIDSAPNVQSLSLRESAVTSRSRKSTFKQIKLMNDKTFSLPKLKFLHWDEDHGNNGLKDIVEVCPNLVRLELRNSPTPNSRTFTDLRWDSLRQLFLSPKNILCDEHCKALSRLQLKLKKLTLFGINPAEKRTMQLLTQLLATLAETLETLELWLDYPTFFTEAPAESFSPLRVSLPHVKRLQTETVILGHLNNLSMLPAMTELEIVSNPFQNTSHNWNDLTKRSSISPQLNLSSFRCGDIDVKSLGKIMKTYPNITSLHLYGTHVDTSALRSIITHLPGLKDFTISPGVKSHLLNLTDSAITGVSNEICKKYGKRPGKFESDDFDLSSVKTQPGISDLKQLQMLNFGLQVSQMSDASIFFGISRLPNLCTLKLPLCEITDLALDIIDKKLPRLVMLSISGCKNVTPEGIQKLQSRRRTLVFEGELSPNLESMIRNRSEI